MASTAQVGRGLGSALGLFFGHREGERRRKKRLKAKADLDEKQLQEARDKELRAARLKIFLQGDRLGEEQEQKFLGTQGFAPTTEQNLFRDINREGFARGSDEEKIFREEMAKRERLKLFERFGIEGEVARKAEATGGVEAGTFGLRRTPGDIQDVAKTEAETRLVEEKILSEKQLGEARKELAAKRKRVESATASGKKSEQMSALKALQGVLVTRIKSLDRIIEADPLEFAPEIKKERADLIEELLGVTKELRAIGGVKETKKPKRVKQSDITKMSVDELFKVLTEK